MNSIKWSKKATKQYEKITPADKPKIVDAVDTLQDMDSARNVTKLVNHVYQHRLRVGRYRVLFNWENDIEVISVEEVAKRDERTY